MRKALSHSFRDLLDKNDFDTLFIDRESIISFRRQGKLTDTNLEVNSNFLRNAEQLSQRFRHIVMLSAAPGPDDDLLNALIMQRVENAGGRIDGFYSEAPSIEGSVPPIIPLRVRRDYPDITFARSVLMSDSAGFHRLGYNCGIEVRHVLQPVEDAPDFAAIDSEMTRLRGSIVQAMDVLAKFMNSTVRINGLRIAYRCICHAIACDHRVYLVFGDDTGFDRSRILSELEALTRDPAHTAHLTVIEPKEGMTDSEQIGRMCGPGDIAIGLAVSATRQEVSEPIEEARRCGAVTISVTGAKPGPLDSTDIVVKIPSTHPAHIQSVMKVIMASSHLMIGEEIKEGKVF